VPAVFAGRFTGTKKVKFAVTWLVSATHLFLKAKRRRDDQYHCLFVVENFDSSRGMQLITLHQAAVFILRPIEHRLQQKKKKNLHFEIDLFLPQK
jgi:hypothetical protein